MVGSYRFGIPLVYLTGLVLGLAQVSFPASSRILKQVHGFSDAQYGAIFLPVVACALIGAWAGAAFAARLGLQRLLRYALLANGIAMLLLAGIAALPPQAAFVTALVATASLGFGFGFSGAPLNRYPAMFFPHQHHSAVVALHMVVGAGLAAGPLLAAPFIAAERWIGFPLLLAAATLALALGSRVVPLPEPPAMPATASAGPPAVAPRHSGVFWVLAAIVVLYALAEGTFSSWAVIYLQEDRGLTEAVAGLALSTFWGALVVGRVLVSLVVLRVPAVRIWLLLPALKIAAFLLLPYATTPPRAFACYALAGLGCSAILPLTISLAAQRFHQHASWVASVLVGALMLGVGLGSFLIGPLREWLALPSLFRYTALYPSLVLLLGLWVLRQDRAGRSTTAAPATEPP